MTDEEYIRMHTKVEQDKNNIYRETSKNSIIIIAIIAIAIIGCLVVYFLK